MVIDRGADKDDVAHIQWNITRSKKERNDAFAATQMDLDINVLSGVIQTKTNIPYDFTYM